VWLRGCDARGRLADGLGAGRHAGLHGVADLGLDEIDVGAHVAGAALDVATDALDLAPDARAALARLALDAGAGLARLALDPATGRGTAALEAAQLLLGALARAVGRGEVVDRLLDEVAGLQRRADRDQDGTLGQLLRLLDGGLDLERVLGAVDVAGRGAALRGGAATRGGGAAARGRGGLRRGPAARVRGR